MRATPHLAQPTGKAQSPVSGVDSTLTSALAGALHSASPREFRFGRGLFSTSLPENRSCADAGISPDLCIVSGLQILEEEISGVEKKDRIDVIRYGILFELDLQVGRYKECLSLIKLPMSFLNEMHVSVYHIPSDDPTTYANIATAKYVQLELRLHAKGGHSTPSHIVLAVKLEPRFVKQQNSAGPTGGGQQAEQANREGVLGPDGVPVLFQRLTEYSHESCHGQVPRPIRPMCLCKADYEVTQVS